MVWQIIFDALEDDDVYKVNLALSPFGFTTYVSSAKDTTSHNNQEVRDQSKKCKDINILDYPEDEIAKYNKQVNR